MKHVERFSPDLVILDIGLPDISGWQVLERLRAVYPAIPVVISSGHVGTCASAEATVVIQKPYTSSQLAVALTQAWTSHPGVR